MASKIDRPKPDRQLFYNLFVKRNPLETLQVISEGLTASIENAGRLLEDARILLKAQKLASSQFLITTADEEMAKSYILLDACRLDFARHENVLQRLCRACYDRVTKYAYNQVLRFPHLLDMGHAGELWKMETTKWWPSGDESGEPDMPHETYFIREMPLYVDFVEYDQSWSRPEKSAANCIFDKWDNGLAEAKIALERLQRTCQAKLHSAESLGILNQNFKGLYISEKTSLEKIRRLYESTALQRENQIGVSTEVFFGSSFNAWPLYHFTTGSQSCPTN